MPASSNRRRDVLLTRTTADTAAPRTKINVSPRLPADAKRGLSAGSAERITGVRPRERDV